MCFSCSVAHKDGRSSQKASHILVRNAPPSSGRELKRGFNIGSDGDSPELRRYVAKRAAAMRAHIDKSSTALKRFIENGKAKHWIALT